MKVYVSLILLIVCVTTLATETPIPNKPINWRQIHGFKNTNATAFVDINSQSKHETDDGNIFGAAGILFVPTGPMTVNVDGVDIPAKSMVRQLVMDCKSSMMALIMDFYFSVDMPTRKDKPIAAFEYEKIVPIGPIPKTSPVYQTLCPNYI